MKSFTIPNHPMHWKIAMPSEVIWRGLRDTVRTEQAKAARLVLDLFPGVTPVDARHPPESQTYEDGSVNAAIRRALMERTALILP